ncbi:MAG: SWIM zinc finger family protein, partial [Proteobacteria bacterium]|nr:SWIM zinc finger family protein [Pseudomonadota bacterium]
MTRGPQSTVMITGEQLRAIAGYAFARGKAYLEEGRVLECTGEGDVIEGRVEGEEIYAVHVEVTPRALVAHCTCPVGGTLCKHAVALVLCHLERTAGAHLARTPLARSEWSKSNADAFTTRADLEAWAMAQQVPHVLDVAADTLCEELPAELVARYGLKYVLGRLALRDVGSRDGAARYLNARGGVEALVAEAAHRVLERGAASVRAAILEEDERTAPADPGLAPLWLKLRAVRRA